MSAMFVFSESDIRAAATVQSYQRGVEYCRAGAVSDLVQRGNLLTAQVEGSTVPYYQVTVTLDDTGAIDRATCTCPYDWGGYCKHIVAMLLAALGGGEITAKPDLETMLASLSEKQLRHLVQALVGTQPALLDAVEREIRWLSQQPAAAAGAGSSAGHSIPVDVAAIRREIRTVMRMFELSEGRGHGDHYDYYDDDAGTIYPEEVLGPHRVLVDQLLDAGDPATAATVLVTMIEAWGEEISDLDEWIYEANEDVLYETAEELSVSLAEALLSMDLSPEERAGWYTRAEGWEDGAVDLEVLETALNHWWDYPPLVAAMQGNISEKGAWEEEAPTFADELALARLRILQRQGRIEEYIHLAEAEGQTSLYINMLARSGETERVVAEAQRYLGSPHEVLALAQVLVEQGEAGAALRVAAHGLGLQQGHGLRELARWTVGQAEQAGDTALALHAARVAFLRGLDLDDYKTAQRLAGDTWPAVKPELLAQMKKPGVFGQPLDVYLYEHMLVDAMAVIDRGSWNGELKRVIEATRADYPAWGIQHCQQQAEGIMDAKQAKYYATAVDWLRLARDIFHQHDRLDEWQAYLNGLLALHARKTKLAPMLKALR